MCELRSHGDAPLLASGKFMGKKMIDELKIRELSLLRSLDVYIKRIRRGL